MRMSPLLRTSCVAVLMALISLSTISMTVAHPAFHQHFNKFVDGNPCLKKCMDLATVEDIELSFVKTANFTEYLLNLSSICQSISTARVCINTCMIDSNPFALESMNAICTPDSILDVDALTPCLVDHGNEVHNMCITECGDYDKIVEEARDLSDQHNPKSVRSQEKVKAVLKLKGESCAVLKCSNRCAVRLMNEKCHTVSENETAGHVIQKLIQRVLNAHRRDLERMKLVDVMTRSLPQQCTYMHLPDTMFNVTTDTATMLLMETIKKNPEAMMKLSAREVLHNGVNGAASPNSVPLPADPSVPDPPVAPAAVAPLVQVMSPLGPVIVPATHVNTSAVAHVHTEMMNKQMDILELQRKNLERESQKLDIEMALLGQEREKDRQRRDGEGHH